jgi:hypothetical protein
VELDGRVEELEIERGVCVILVEVVLIAGGLFGQLAFSVLVIYARLTGHC